MYEKTEILIVEDEKVISMDLKLMLENAGYNVIGTVSSFEEAIEKAREDVPDLIIMDIIIEGHGNGIDAAKRIRRRYNIPIIYLTAFSNAELLLNNGEGGPKSKFLVKPVSEKQLIAAVKEVV